MPLEHQQTSVNREVRPASLWHATLLVAALGCGQSDGSVTNKTNPNPASATAKIVVVSPTKGMENYPCEQCHQHVEGNRGSIENAHSTIVVKHMPDAACKSCHDAQQPDKLVLASGVKLELEDLHKLCGQCHSTQVSDWEVGIHGKQVGNWQRNIHRYSCTKCHNPHIPKFGTMQALPSPEFPRLGIPKGNH